MLFVIMFQLYISLLLVIIISTNEERNLDGSTKEKRPLKMQFFLPVRYNAQT
jgi:hypothetical protein